MAFGSFQDHSAQRPMAEINVTPMVDVMLVLLVIFIITAPLFNHEIKLNLPNVEAKAAPSKPDTIELAIDTRGRLFWNNQLLPNAELASKLKQAAQKKPQPDLALRADNETRYEEVVKVMSAAQKAGLLKLGFVTEPKLPASQPKPRATPAVSPTTPQNH